MKRTFSIIIIIGLFFLLTGCTQKQDNNKEFKIVTSFYPMYTIAKNIAGDIDGVKVENMTSNNVRMFAQLYTYNIRLKKNRRGKCIYI